MLHVQHNGTMKHTEPSAADRDVLSEINHSCLLTRTHRISRVVTNIYEQELRVFGLNSHQFSLLVVIFRVGPASRAEIGRFNHQDRSTLTRNLKVVLSEGWVEEIPHLTAGRIRPIMLTKSGREILRRAVPAWRVAQAQALSLLGESGVVAIKDIADGL
jgi:DNA-binding MarR family transcriptional regulator